MCVRAPGTEAVCGWVRVRRMGCDDYIIASIELYLDVMNVFQFMMLLLSGGDL